MNHFSRLKSLFVCVLLSASALGAGCGENARSSSSTNWLRCQSDADCAAVAGAVCRSDSICVDAEGHPIPASTASSTPSASGGDGGAMELPAPAGSGGTGGSAGAAAGGSAANVGGSADLVCPSMLPETGSSCPEPPTPEYSPLVCRFDCARQNCENSSGCGAYQADCTQDPDSGEWSWTSMPGFSCTI